MKMLKIDIAALERAADGLELTFIDCDHDAEFKEQIFHKENRGNFGDYEELEDRIPKHLPERDFINRYYTHCRQKVASAIETKTRADLVLPDADVRRNRI